MTPDPEQFWADVLSEDAELVVTALLGLSPEERTAALAHLQAMAHEAGWADGQARRARAALTIAAGDTRLFGVAPRD